MNLQSDKAIKMALGNLDKALKQLEAMEVSLHSYETRTNKDKLYKLLHPEFIEIGYSGSTHNFKDIISEFETKTEPNYTVWSQDFECFDLSGACRKIAVKHETRCP